MSYRQQSFSRIFTSLIVSFNLVIPQAAFATPEGGVVTGGSASISGADTDSMIIDQTSQRSFIEWDSFNVGEGQSVEFRQPNSNAVTANKVIGTDPSEIFGQITANGRLLIINGNGIIFGANSVIDAAAFIATTHNLSTDDFMNGDDALDFSGGTASIINNGNIALREGGFAALLAPQIVNNGIITARLGKIDLAASQSVSVDFYGDGLLSFAADDVLTQSLEDSNAALIDQQGQLLADGGVITMTTRAASDVINRSVNIGGLVRANAVSEENGRIILSADSAVIIEDDGILRSDGNDGSISISGTQIAQGGVISASGTSGAGTISLNATGRLSLAGTTSAIASSGQGGQISYRAGTIIENSSSVTNVSGTTQGGGIMVQAEIGMISSGAYFANASSGTAGQIDITGNDIRLLGTTIEAKGTSQGGLVRVGGAFQGGKSPDFSQSYVDSFVTRWPDAGSLKNANQVFINNSAVINVTSQDGTAGTAIIWSDDTTTFLGSINATGQSGGSVEVSSATLLRHANLAGIEVGDGTLLLDPKNITIGSSTEIQSWSFDGIIGQWYSIDYDPDLLRSDERFGQAVSLSTDSTKLAVGAHGNDGFGNSLNMVGAVHLFTFTNSNYGGAQLQGTIGSGYTGGNNVSVTNLQAGDLFGKSVSLDSDGDRLAVGAPGDQGASNDKPEQGAVYLFTFTNTSFAGGQLAATIGKGYSDLNMTAIASNDAFGSSVSLNGTSDRLAVGAIGDDGNGDSTSGSGAVYLLYFGNNSFGTPTLHGTIGDGYSGGNDVDLSTLDAGDMFGSAVDFTADSMRLLIGAPGDDGKKDDTTNAGAAYLYGFENANFKNPTLLSAIGKDYTGNSNVQPSVRGGDSLGTAVAINSGGDLVAIGAAGDDGYGQSTDNNYGAVHLIRYTNSEYTASSIIGKIGYGYTPSGSYNHAELNTNDAFGTSVALNGSGNRLAVGAPTGDGFGNSLSNSGDVYLISFTDTAFSGVSKDSALGDNRLNNPFPNNSYVDNEEEFGAAVSLNGDATRLAVSALDDGGNPDSVNVYGAVHLYSFTDSNYSGATLQGTIGNGYSGGKNVSYNPGNGDEFGVDVSLNSAGDRLAVGETGETGGGAVRLFTFTDTSFTGGSLAASIYEGASGGDNVNITLDDNDDFGASVDLSGDGKRLAVGAPGDDGSGNSGTNRGAVYLFTFNDTSFDGGQLITTVGSGYNTGSDFSVSTLADGDAFGSGVSLDYDANRLAVGAEGDAGPDGKSGAGAAYLIEFGDASFTSASLSGIIGDGYTGSGYLNVSNLNSSDAFGSDLSLNATGDRLIVGAVGDDGDSDGASNSGAAYLFSFSDDDFSSPTLRQTFGSGYTSSNQLDVTHLEDNDGFGASVSLNDAGDRLAVGNQFDDGMTGSNTNAGAVFLFSASRASGGYPASGQTYAANDSSDVTVNAYEIADIMTRGSNIILQASNDITVSNAIEVGTFSSSNGDLTLSAGRSIIINETIRSEGGDINLYANTNLADGVQDAQRDTGEAVISLANTKAIIAGTGDVDIAIRVGTGKTYSQSGDISLGTNAMIAGDLVTIVNAGPTSGSDITLASGASISASNSGDAITLAADNFINNAGASALSVPNGRFQIWSTNPSSDTLGGITSDFIQYDATYGTSSVSGSSSQDGLLYTYQPTVSPNFRASTVKTYDGTATATVVDGDIGVTGAQAGDTVVLTAASASFDNKNAGTGKTVTLSGLSVASAARGAVTIYGYGVSTNTASNSDGTINQKPISMTGHSVANKQYDGTTTGTATFGSLTGVESGDTVTLDTSSASAAFINAGVGTNKTVTISGITLGGTDGANYGLTTPTTTADITQKTLTLSSATAANKTYNADTAATISSYGGLTGIVNSEAVILDSSSASASFADANVGSSKSVSISGLALTGANASNYTLSSSFSTTADITAKALTITAPSASDKVYDADTSATVTAGTLSGFIGSETVTVSGSGTFSDANVGSGKSVTVTYSLADGTNNGLASNYSLSSGSTTADITTKALTITAPSASNKIYDADTSATVTAGTLSGFIGSETVTVTGSGTFADANVGSGKSVTVTYSLADGTNNGLASNYSLSSGSTTADITAKALTITAPSASNKVYDADTSATVTAGTLSGFIGSETVTATGTGTF
ncbi:MAG: YDG domain-containing protein, partial [Candidatus Puniceispirillaceae bacterium]